MHMCIECAQNIWEVAFSIELCMVYIGNSWIEIRFCISKIITFFKVKLVSSRKYKILVSKLLSVNKIIFISNFFFIQIKQNTKLNYTMDWFSFLKKTLYIKRSIVLQKHHIEKLGGSVY